MIEIKHLKTLQALRNSGSLARLLYIPQAQFVHAEVKDFHDRD